MPWIAASVLAAALAALALLHFREQAPETPLVKFSIAPPEGTAFALAGNAGAPAVISPDGKRLVFGAGSADGKCQLWVRSLDTLAAQPLANTDGASFPFWSADSRSIGFFADEKLKKIEEIEKFIDLIADMLVLAAAAYAAKPGPLLAAMEEVRKDLKA